LSAPSNDATDHLNPARRASRRALLKGAAWSVPAVAIAAAAPAYALSPAFTVAFVSIPTASNANGTVWGTIVVSVKNNGIHATTPTITLSGLAGITLTGSVSDSSKIIAAGVTQSYTFAAVSISRLVSSTFLGNLRAKATAPGYSDGSGDSGTLPYKPLVVSLTGATGADQKSVVFTVTVANPSGNPTSVATIPLTVTNPDAGTVAWQTVPAGATTTGTGNSRSISIPVDGGLTTSAVLTLSWGNAGSQRHATLSPNGAPTTATYAVGSNTPAATASIASK